MKRLLFLFAFSIACSGAGAAQFMVAAANPHAAHSWDHIEIIDFQIVLTRRDDGQTGTDLGSGQDIADNFPINFDS